MIEIRESTAEDLPGILATNRAAFGSDIEAELVRALLADPSAQPRLSLIAYDGERTVGHILFTHARLTGASASLLAPLSAQPDAQRRGVGGRLIEEGVERLKDRGVDLVFVLGHPDYYPRHGFEPAIPHGYLPTYPIAAHQEDAWMVRRLRDGASDFKGGTVACADALDKPEYWVE